MNRDKTKIFALWAILLSVGLQLAAAVRHSLQYFYTASSGVKGFPEFVTVGMIDGQPFFYYDSVLKKAIPKQDWMAENEDAEYWQGETLTSISTERSFKVNIYIAEQRFNQTGGVHVFQKMYGCDWDDETNKTTGYYQFGYDGEDFLTLNLTTESWIASKPQALLTKQKWESDRVYFKIQKNYFHRICPEWLKKYLNYGRKSLMRTELPSMRILQKAFSSTMRCHATGFYPNRADLFWRKDGEEIHEGVDKGEILPNHDGSFQMSSDLKLSSSEDRTRYECVFQLAGVREDLITKLEKDFPVGAVIGGVLVLLVLVIAGVGVLYWKRKRDGFVKADSSDTSSNPSEDPAQNKAQEEKKMLDQSC